MKKLFTALVMLGFTVAVFGQDIPWDVKGRGLSFKPDYTFKGSTLTGWNSIGTSNWKANNGEISINPNGGTALLALGKLFQDVAVNLLIKAAPGTEAGVMVRMQKTAGGYKGFLVAVKDGDAASYSITMDAQGKELSRQELRIAGNIIRVAPPAPKAEPDAPAQRRGGGGGNRQSGPADLPIARPSTAIVANDWNQFEIIIDYTIIRKFINDGGDATGGATDDDGAGFGPIALYAKGTGEVQFKNISYKDVHVLYTPKEASSARFKVQRVSDMSYSFSANAADFNRDGVMDIVAGPYVYYGPDYTHYQEVMFAQTYNPSREFPNINCQYTFDFNGDGWPDILTGPGAKTAIYINPKGESRRWDRFEVGIEIQSEVTVFKDIDGDGKPELIYSGGNAMCYAKFNPADATKPWVEHAVSAKGYGLGHGCGAGDINGDGRLDIINPNGWWEQPKDLSSTWTYHPAAFGRYGHRSSGVGGSVMAVYDVNGDGLNDVVASLNVHGFGLAWFEQKKDKNGAISFVQHMIMDDYSTANKNTGGVTFSQSHGSTYADVSGDGIPDFIVGKRYWTHLDSYFDPDPYGPAVLYVYVTVRNKKAPGGARFVPELIHNRSGAGSDVATADLNGDGAIDVISSADRGTFIFWNQTKAKKSTAKK
jgi:hypothetical protein